MPFRTSMVTTAPYVVASSFFKDFTASLMRQFGLLGKENVAFTLKKNYEQPFPKLKVL